MPKSIQIRNQMKQAFPAWESLRRSGRPLGGWIRSIREALGMSGRQLAGRLGVHPSRITEMEKAEAAGQVSVATLKRAAEAMDCEFVYALVPKVGLEETLRHQAWKAARSDLKSVSQTMHLEAQGLSVQEEELQLAHLVEEWVKNPPRRLWDTR
jgi:predicted DNA-binding mobile mystery protein A